MKNNLILVFLCAIYLLALFLNQKIIWGFYFGLFVIILISRQKLIYRPSIFIIILLLPILWTFLLSYKYSFYSNVQGLFYLSIPIIMISIGYQILKLLSLKQVMIYIVYLGTISSLIYISIILYKVGFIAVVSPYEEARLVVGSGSPASILSLVISAFSEKYGYKIFRDKLQKTLFIVINIIAIYLFASRTYWVILIIFLFIFNIKLISKHKVLSFFFFGIGLYLALNYSARSNAEAFSTKSLATKMLKSLSEIRFSNYSKYSDINIHFRGYEAYRAYKTYTEGTFVNILFGHGLGKQVDLKASVYLAGSYRRVIPYIHNGYFFVLLKEGIFGLIGLLLFLYYLLKTGIKELDQNNTQKRFICLLIIGSTITMALTNYVICSMFSIEMTIILITIGVLIQALKSEKSKKELLD